MDSETAPKTLAEALAALQTKLPRIGKDKTAKVQTKAGGSYSYDYANLTAVSEKILPLLGELGLSFTCLPTLTDDGRFVLAYALQFRDGTDVGGRYPLPQAGSPQEIGSAITYARRYCLCAVTGAAPDEDDDDAQAAQTAADGLKRNKNGQISRKGNTAAQLAASGNMTNEQLREHEKLRDEGHIPIGDLEILDRMPAEDEWSAVDASGERREPGQLPKPIGPQPPKPARGAIGVIVRQFERLGVIDREERLVYTSRLAGRELTSSKDMTPEEARTVADKLSHCRDIGQLQEPEPASA